MNRNQAKAMLPIIQAYAEGKEIEIFDKTTKMRKVTCICDTIIKGVTFVKGCDYRVDYNPFIGIMVYALSAI